MIIMQVMKKIARLGNYSNVDFFSDFRNTAWYLLETQMCPYPNMFVLKRHENTSMYAYRVSTYAYLDHFRSITSNDP